MESLSPIQYGSQKHFDSAKLDLRTVSCSACYYGIKFDKSNLKFEKGNIINKQNNEYVKEIEEIKKNAYLKGYNKGYNDGIASLYK